MTDMYRPLSDDREHPTNRAHDDFPPSASSKEATRTLLAGVLGGLVSAAGYLIYNRLPDDQKDRLHQQARTLLETRVNELRSRFNL